MTCSGVLWVLNLAINAFEDRLGSFDTNNKILTWIFVVAVILCFLGTVLLFIKKIFNVF